MKFIWQDSELQKTYSAGVSRWRKVTGILKWFCLLVLLLLVVACTYEPLAPPQAPKFYQKINLPLADVTLDLASLVDSTNHIFGDSLGDSLFFRFAGPLDTVTLTEDIFRIPGGAAVDYAQRFDALTQAQAELDTTIAQTIKLSQVLHLPVPLPWPVDVTLDSVPRMPIADETRDFQVFDRYGIPFFERVDYLTIGSGTYSTEVSNHLLVDLDSVIIIFRNKNGEVLAQTFLPRIPAGETRRDGLPGNLNGKKLRDSVEVVLSAVIAGTDRQPLTIPAGNDPYVTIAVVLDLESIESFTGLPLPIQSRAAEKLPSSRNTIFRAKLANTQTAPLDTNCLSLSINNTLPLNLGMRLTFYNFFQRTTPLVIDTVVSSGALVTVDKRLDGYTFRNPDSTTIVDSIIVSIEVDILPDEGETTVTIPLALGDSEVNVNLGLGNLVFQFIEGFFNESFTIPPMTIKNIPVGFANIEFSSVLLILHFYNQIQARTDINLTIEGMRRGYNPVRVTSSGTIKSASSTKPVAHSVLDIDIAPVFNLVPDSILVSGSAVIPSSDTSHLEVGNSFWGTFEIVVPFQMKIQPMTFIPVTSNRLAAIDKKTRQKIESGLIESSIITQINNDFSFDGVVDILMSNYDYFPIAPDSADSGFVWINDSLYAQTDTGLFHIVIDTLVHLELPPAVIGSDGRVRVPGFCRNTAVFDSLKMKAILRDEDHYIRPRIYLNGKDDFVLVGYWDKIQIVSMISLTVDGGKIISPDEEPEEQGEEPFSKPNPPTPQLARQVKVTSRAQ